MSEEQALNAVAAANALVFAIGLGGEVSTDFLTKIGTGGFFPISSVNLLRVQVLARADLCCAERRCWVQFGLIAERLQLLTSNNYLVGYCSPSRNLDHTLSVSFRTVCLCSRTRPCSRSTLSRSQSTVSVSFSAAGFTGRCSKASVDACRDCERDLQIPPDKQRIACSVPTPPRQKDNSALVIIAVLFGLLGFFFLLGLGVLVYRKVKESNSGWSMLSV